VIQNTLKAVMGGQDDEVLDLARTNLWRQGGSDGRTVSRLTRRKYRMCAMRAKVCCWHACGERASPDPAGRRITGQKNRAVRASLGEIGRLI